MVNPFGVGLYGLGGRAISGRLCGFFGGGVLLGGVLLGGVLLKASLIIQQPVRRDLEGARQQGQLGDFGGGLARFPYLKIQVSIIQSCR